MKAEALNHLISGRRSFYQNEYTGERVDDSIIRQMLENARWAPTHKLTEPWRFKVYTGASLDWFANKQAEFYRSYTQRDNTYKEDRYQNLLVKPKLSSHIIAVGMARDPKRSVPEVEELGAVFCAVQNMYLTASAYEIGCYLSTGGITYFDGAQQILGWDDSVTLIGFMHVGVPKEKQKSGKRSPLVDKVEWHT